KRGLELKDDEMADIYGRWNEGPLASYLVEITGQVFRREDSRTTKHLIDMILDEAKQKGTGMWTSQDAMELQVPVPTIDVAVAMRNLSAMKEEREQASRAVHGPAQKIDCRRDSFLAQLSDALYASMIVTYAQGMSLLYRASGAYQYGLNLEDVARIWRGGCIIRAALLDDILAAFRTRCDLPNLLLDDRLASRVAERQSSWRSVIQAAVQSGIPVPAMAASLAYFDAYRSAWLPANLVEAQRDFFGAHTFERIDAKGSFHVEWSQPEPPSVRAQATAGAGDNR
ncbi:MAG: NADP-dependent phosphogluconate dehydrogenase, partial [Planctomycetes bacterium]|nr:NADP-dependent phosphogluconate dehydrogenase [Planctomycetota bacterium]